jgi:Txe/YoeB family toxin of Txe-Axe toxin-antitoxin module
MQDLTGLVKPVRSCFVMMIDRDWHYLYTLGKLRGYWSRRITDEHRLVYKVTDGAVFVASCKYHYN